MSHTFTIENSDHSIQANGELSNYPDTTFGETASFEFYLRDETGLAPASERYQTLKSYLNYAGYATAERTEKSVYFWEDGFSQSPINTLLVSIQPDSDIEEARGVWGIITGGSDSTEVFGAQARIGLEVFVLAEYDDYATEQDVRDAFEYQI